MHINQLEINNFRGIKQCLIEELGQINLFFGGNNSGKTTILETVFLSIGVTNPELAVNIHNFRNMLITENEDLSFLFYNLDYKNRPDVVCHFNEGAHRRHLEIKPTYRSQQSIEKTSSKQLDVDADLSSAASTSGNLQVLDGIEFEINIKEKHKREKNLKAALSIERNGVMNAKVPNKYSESASGTFVGSSHFHFNPSTRIEKLIIAKKQGQLINVLQGIDPRIQDVTIGTNGMIYFDVAGIDRLIPSNIMGDGIRRVLSVIATISDSKNGIVLVDEIENGLHYKTQELLWKAVILGCKEFNVQLWATTHSKENIGCLSKVVSSEDARDKVGVSCYGVVRRNEDTLSTYRYEPDQILYSLENNVELRDL